MSRMLILAILPMAAGANCVTDAPEIGDIGPSSALVCQWLDQRFPEATLAVEDRSIHSPREVSVDVRVDGTPVALRYELSGAIWRLDEPGAQLALASRVQEDSGSGD